MAMSEKAKKYLKEIKGAKTIPELKDVEIAIKRDGILAWAEFTKLNEAVEEKKVALRKKKQETSLQEILFWAYQKGIRQAAEDDGRGSRQGCHPDAGPALRQHRPDHCRGRPRR
ncbi:hypothetical protein EfmAA610_20360 [Enterococcus faecium]|nr:hypothetical protein EfmAA610_20360 [Enterococcus faecium]